MTAIDDSWLVLSVGFFGGKERFDSHDSNDLLDKSATTMKQMGCIDAITYENDRHKDSDNNWSPCILLTDK